MSYPPREGAMQLTEYMIKKESIVVKKVKNRRKHHDRNS